MTRLEDDAEVHNERRRRLERLEPVDNGTLTLSHRVVNVFATEAAEIDAAAAADGMTAAQWIRRAILRDLADRTPGVAELSTATKRTQR